MGNSSESFPISHTTNWIVGILITTILATFCHISSQFYDMINILIMIIIILYEYILFYELKKKRERRLRPSHRASSIYTNVM